MFGKRKQAVDATAVEALRDLAFFEGFTDAQLGRVAELATEVEVAAGEVLIDQGRVGQECFVVVDGTAGVFVGDEHVVSVEPGTMVGEMALVEHRPRSATVVAETPMRLIAFDTAAFRQLLAEMPRAEERVMQLLADRLRANQAGARPDAGRRS